MIEQLQAWLVGGLIVVGSVFLTVGTIGLLRFDTVYNRMHATSKPTTLGVAAIFGAGFVQFGPGGAGMPSLLAIVFLFLTIPTGTHMIARSAERMGVPFREGVTWPEPPGGDPTSRERGRESSRRAADSPTDEGGDETAERAPSDGGGEGGAAPADEDGDGGGGPTDEDGDGGTAPTDEDGDGGAAPFDGADGAEHDDDRTDGR